MAYENIFLGAKRLENGMLSIEVNVEEAEKYDAFHHIGFAVTSAGGAGANPVVGINVFGNEFRQNEMNYVDTFPNMVHYIKNHYSDLAPGCLNFDPRSSDVQAIFIYVVDRMQQYNQPPEMFALDIIE